MPAYVVFFLSLSLSPWLFGFAEQIFIPHLLIGIFEITAGLMTSRAPFQLGKEMSVRTAHHS